jgi:hypothetical protein
MHGRIAIGLATLFTALLMPMVVAGRAVDDPSIRGALRAQIWFTMDDYIVSQSGDGIMRLYDPIEDRVLLMEFRRIHEGIVREGDFFVSCADFVDQDGRKLDVDLLVLQSGENLQVTQAIVHKIDEIKRQNNLSETDIGYDFSQFVHEDLPLGGGKDLNGGPSM